MGSTDLSDGVEGDTVWGKKLDVLWPWRQGNLWHLSQEGKEEQNIASGKMSLAMS